MRFKCLIKIGSEVLKTYIFIFFNYVIIRMFKINIKGLVFRKT